MNQADRREQHREEHGLPRPVSPDGYQSMEGHYLLGIHHELVRIRVAVEQLAGIDEPAEDTELSEPARPAASKNQRRK